jgi:mannose-6-phosphate isomerase-like protein (cupin superfamily)
MRRVVVAVDGDGKSFVASDEVIADAGRIWTADRRNLKDWLDAVDPDHVYRPAQPLMNGAFWYLSELPAGKGMRPAADASPGIDERGFHVTKTTDLVYILSGRALLDLDRSTVELGAGDAVVLQAATHAWRNPTSEPVRFLDVLMSEE